MSLTAFLVLIGDALVGSTLESARQPVVNFLSGLTRQPTESQEQPGALLWQSSVYADESAVALACAKSPDFKRTIVFDGWIENREEVLVALGTSAPDANSSDSLLVLAGYAVWGDQLAERLYGEYAFVIVERKLGVDQGGLAAFAVRDKVGIRPLFYSQWQGGMALSNFPGALSVLPWVGSEINEGFAAEFLCANIVSVNETLYLNVSRLCGGHRLSWQSGKQPRIERYWRLGGRVEHLNESDGVAQLREVLVASVCAASKCTGPLGCQVSGGIDSSSVAMIVADLIDVGKLSADDVVGMSQIYPGLACDETPYIDAIEKVVPFSVERLVARYCTADEADAFTLRLRYIYGTFAGTAAWRHFLAHRARGGRVVLTGEGGDQLFQPSALAIWKALTSYREVRYALQYFRLRWRKSPSTASMLGRLRFTLGVAVGSAANVFLQRRDDRNSAFRRWPVNDSWASDVALAQRLDRRIRLDDARTLAVSYSQSGVWSVGYETIHSAALLLGVEVRHPLSSARVIERAARFPLRFFDGLQTLNRYPLREAVVHRLPAITAQRATKAEFTCSALPALILMASHRIKTSSLSLRRGREFTVNSDRSTYVWRLDAAQAFFSFLQSRVLHSEELD